MQKEQLSALMDGEALDQTVIAELAKDEQLQENWQRYHLVRDVLRGDLGPVVHVDIAARVAEAIANEQQTNVVPLITESQPTPAQWRKKGIFKTAGWGAQLAQVGVAACVSLAVIVGVQHYNHPAEGADTQDTPAFNTLPMMGKASPVSLGVPSAMFDKPSSVSNVEQQRAQINAMVQDYELQRRLNDNSGAPQLPAVNDQKYSGNLHQ